MFQFQYFHIPRTLSRDYCTRALQALEKIIKKPQQGIINLIVIGPEEMARMNQQFRGKDGPTDILTFSYIAWEKREKRKEKRERIVKEEDIAPLIKVGEEWVISLRVEWTEMRGNLEVAGEIYLCLEKIKIYAKEREHSYKEELEHIVVHGLVHLMGYDHETEEDFDKMQKIENKIITSL